MVSCGVTAVHRPAQFEQTNRGRDLCDETVIASPARVVGFSGFRVYDRKRGIRPSVARRVAPMTEQHEYPEEPVAFPSRPNNIRVGASNSDWSCGSGLTSTGHSCGSNTWPRRS